MRPRLVIFAKAPLMGAAKTRLAADIGPTHAQRLYRAMTQAVIRQCRDARWDTVVALAPDRWIYRLPHVTSPQISQGTGSLTPRLVRAMSVPGPVCVIGTDCPQVEARDIAEAFSALRGHDLVLGPADDGGFWLIGARGPVSSGLFNGVRWSSETALADVAANASGPVAYLRTLTDVDDAAALRTVRRAARAGSTCHARRLS